MNLTGSSYDSYIHLSLSLRGIGNQTSYEWDFVAI